MSTIFAEIDTLSCDHSLDARARLAEKLEQARQQAMAEAIPYDLFLRVEESVRAILRDDDSRNPSSNATDETQGLQYCPCIEPSLR
jgi:hypothetical protein